MTEIKKIEGFTPGPWVNKRFSNGIFHTEEQNGATLCTTSGAILALQETSANASLIAYAPDLYKIALEQQKEIARLKSENEDLKNFIKTNLQ